jgi:hypothetical protein
MTISAQSLSSTEASKLKTLRDTAAATPGELEKFDKELGRIVQEAIKLGGQEEMAALKARIAMGLRIKFPIEP